MKGIKSVLLTLTLGIFILSLLSFDVYAAENTKNVHMHYKNTQFSKKDNGINLNKFGYSNTITDWPYQLASCTFTYKLHLRLTQIPTTGNPNKVTYDEYLQSQYPLSIDSTGYLIGSSGNMAMAYFCNNVYQSGSSYLNSTASYYKQNMSQSGMQIDIIECNYSVSGYSDPSSDPSNIPNYDFTGVRIYIPTDSAIVSTTETTACDVRFRIACSMYNMFGQPMPDDATFQGEDEIIGYIKQHIMNTSALTATYSTTSGETGKLSYKFSDLKVNQLHYDGKYLFGQILFNNNFLLSNADITLTFQTSILIYLKDSAITPTITNGNFQDTVSIKTHYKDTNDDGKDDDSGQPIPTPPNDDSGSSNPVLSILNDINSMLSMLKTAIQSIGGVISALVTSSKELSNLWLPVSDLLKLAFGWLPSEVQGFIASFIVIIMSFGFLKLVTGRGSNG